jgi:hypothetical protein
MPKTKQTVNSSEMLDSWGRRNNRKIPDKACEICGKVYRPAHAKSRFCSRPCLWATNGGHNKKPETWWITKKGYIEGRIWLPDGTKVCVKQHRFIMEGLLGRPLLANEDVHHLDGNKANNSSDNLQLITHGNHSTISNSKRTYKTGYQMKLTPEARQQRSMRAIASQLSEIGRTAINKSKKLA